MTKKPWSLQELDKLIRLSTEYPRVVIARELFRPVTSVRKKMRDIGLSYVTGEQWNKQQIQYLISDEGGILQQSDKSNHPKKRILNLQF